MPQKTEYIGRYTVPEYAQVKQQMIRNHPELKPYKIDDVCRYIAKKDWPAERRMTYMYAKNQHDIVARELNIYDECQDLFDKVHHGETFIRFYDEITSVPEANRLYPGSAVALALGRGTYTGPIPWQHRDLVTQDQQDKDLEK